jgi:hypothetical protein
MCAPSEPDILLGGAGAPRDIKIIKRRQLLYFCPGMKKPAFCDVQRQIPCESQAKRKYVKKKKEKIQL